MTARVIAIRRCVCRDGSDGVIEGRASARGLSQSISRAKGSFFWAACRNPALPFVAIVKIGQLARLMTWQGAKMPQYLISTYLPDDFDPSLVTEETVEAIHALNREMIAAGVRKFACGLSPKALTVRSQPNGEVVVTDGPYIETKEYVGGLSILETENIEEVLAWMRKSAKVLHGVVEVREIFFNPPPAED